VPVHVFFVVCYCFLFLDRLRLVYFCNYEMGSFVFCRNSLSIVACVAYTFVLLSFFVRRLPASSRSSGRASVPVQLSLLAGVKSFPQLSYF